MSCQSCLCITEVFVKVPVAQHANLSFLPWGVHRRLFKTTLRTSQLATIKHCCATARFYEQKGLRRFLCSCWQLLVLAVIALARLVVQHELSVINFAHHNLLCPGGKSVKLCRNTLPLLQSSPRRNRSAPPPRQRAMNLGDHVCSVSCNCSERHGHKLIQSKLMESPAAAFCRADSLLVAFTACWRFPNGWRMPLVRHSSNIGASSPRAQPCSWSRRHGGRRRSCTQDCAPDVRSFRTFPSFN